MILELSDLNNGSVYIGDKLGVRSKFIFDEPSTVSWAGLRLITIPPCNKQEIQIAREEIFSRGFFEPGEYIRDKAILIKTNVVPTIKKRNLTYNIELVFRTKNPINPDDDLVVKKSKEIEIKVKNDLSQIPLPNPISFSISGLNINLNKDVFKPGETIKINYSSNNLKQLEVRLLQKSNIVCYCRQYGGNCRNVEELPPAIAGDAKTSNTEKGFLLLKIPEIAEPSHNYLYQASEKDLWGMKIGDYTQWSLLVIGTKKPEFGRDKIQLEIPITIAKKIPIEEKRPELDIFSGEPTGGMNVFDSITSKFQKRFQLVSIDSVDSDEGKEYSIKIKNISKEDLEGITIKLTGLQEGLFETRPLLLGFKSWKKDEEKEIKYNTKQNISAIISIIEDNSQKSVRIQTPITF
ncbi:MAG: hypothetical protein ACTSQP_07220 [Promethearchaeota archaeon]